MKSSLESKKTPKEIQHKDLFLCQPLPPSKFFVFAFFSYISRRKQPNTKNFRGSRPLKQLDSGMGFLVNSLCLGVFSALNFGELSELSFDSSVWGGGGGAWAGAGCNILKTFAALLDSGEFVLINSGSLAKSEYQKILTILLQ